MPDVNYSDSEIALKDNLECLFWIEIAKRKSRLEQPETFSRLLELRQEVDAFLENQRCTSSMVEVSGYRLFDVIQLGYHRDKSVFDPEGDEILLNQALERFGREVESVYNELAYLKGFYLAEFSDVTDFKALHGWWSYITSQKGRKNLNAKGIFSNIGKEFSSDDGGLQILTTQAPVQFPRRLHEKQISIFSTENNEIEINGENVKDCVVLVLDTLNPLLLMQRIEYAIRSTHSRARFNRRWAEINEARTLCDQLKNLNSTGEDSPEMIDASIRYVSLLEKIGDDGPYIPLSNFLYYPPASHKLMKGVDNIRPMIFGFFCWDLVNDGMTQAEAGRCAENTLTGNGGAKVYSAKNAIYGFKRVGGLVREYAPTKLPWS